MTGTACLQKSWAVNTFVGGKAAESNTTGSNNIAIGKDAYKSATTADANTIIGSLAGDAITKMICTSLSNQKLVQHSIGWSNQAMTAYFKARAMDKIHNQYQEQIYLFFLQYS